jgi:Protein of unknown function DUF2625
MTTMKKITSTLILAFTILTTFAQYKMRPVDQLINRTDPGWRVVKQWIDSAKNKVEILPVDTSKAKDALYKTQVTTRSIMGAIVYSTGGLLIDNGWIRILGSGCFKMQRTLPDWNKGKAFKEFGERPAFFLVADDAAGGFFAINYGSFGKDLDSIYYLSPDNLEWEPLEMNYEDFVWFCFRGDIKKFYKGIRWNSWQKDIQTLKADEVFSILPPLWSKEGKDVEKSFRKPVPAEEQFSNNLQLRKQMGLEKTATNNN